eukprot:359362-Chlamydomonas_euryale.AAC.9
MHASDVPSHLSAEAGIASDTERQPFTPMPIPAARLLVMVSSLGILTPKDPDRADPFGFTSSACTDRCRRVQIAMPRAARHP